MPRLVKGENDLKTKYPEIALEADGWDPSAITYGSKKSLPWKCNKGHKWIAKPNSRTTDKGRGCPYCTNRIILIGFNDLSSQFPDLAREADGWDPSKILFGSAKKVDWKCNKGHKWKAKVVSRTRQNQGCPFCRNVRVWKGFNDLKTHFPEIAKQAYGWDPSEYVKGSKKSLYWKCQKGHIWDETIDNRTRQGYGCPICSNKRLSIGVNDLKTHFPEIAKQAYGWDPSKYRFGSATKLPWKCQKGHIWKTNIDERTRGGTGCPFCCNNKVWKGFNDLETKFPEIAKQAYGWDPSKYLFGSSIKLPWKCHKGHIWETKILERTLEGKQTGCPICANRKILKGFNDLETHFPEVAKEADGWDPSKYLFGSGTKLPWKCKEGHTWKTKIVERTGKDKTGCPFCSNKKVWKGFNDLQTIFPEVAKEADGWDPSKYLFGSGKKVSWICNKGHKWKAIIGIRTRSRSEIHKLGTGCPECATGGFKKTRPAWFYLMGRKGEQQLGITNDINQRFAYHSVEGWKEIDKSGPHPGYAVYDLELLFKKWLKKEIGLVPGTRENWYISKMQVNSLQELKKISGIETSFF